MKKVNILLMLLCFHYLINAQDQSRNTGNFQIHPGASITFAGILSNSSTASIVNNGNLHLKGNVINDQNSMTAATGVLYLVGTSTQTISGSQPLKIFNLVTNNAAGFILNNDLSIAGEHIFTAGMITTSSIPNYLIYEAGSSYSGNGDDRHVNGWVKKIGSTNFSFPVGDGTYQRKIDILNLSAASEFNCHYYTVTPNIFQLAPPLVQVNDREYWQLDKISGGTAQVGLNWDHSKVAFNNVLISDIKISRFTGGNWTNAGGTASGNVTTTGTVPASNVLSSFGLMTFGYTSYPLQLTFVSHSGERRNGASQLTWITENEQEVNRFDVQFSKDGSSFLTIGTIAARNIPARQQYAFEDHRPLNGVIYYRIRSVDEDGGDLYSKVVALTENNFINSDIIVRSPVRHVITIINKTGQEGMFGYILFNSSGQQVLKGEILLYGNAGTTLPLPGQTAAGVYYLELRNETVLFKEKIWVER